MAAAPGSRSALQIRASPGPGAVMRDDAGHPAVTVPTFSPPELGQPRRSAPSSLLQLLLRREHGETPLQGMTASDRLQCHIGPESREQEREEDRGPSTSLGTRL